MDLTQTKLTKSEWTSIEIPVTDTELKILTLIDNGYQDINLKINEHPSMMSILKIDFTKEIEYYLFVKYFQEEILKLVSKSSDIQKAWLLTYKKTNIRKKDPKKTDVMRLVHMDKNIEKQKDRIFEFTLLKFCSYIIEDFANGTKTKYPFYVYTLTQMKKSTISKLNCYVQNFVDFVIDMVYQLIPTLCKDVFYNIYKIIEKNPYILQYEDVQLYEHQKELFQTFKNSQDKSILVLYTSATGSGKTVSPIGLSIGHRIIYICAARHVGLALAKSSISMGKCVAFAFGCESADDIRLHYHSAVEFTKNKKSGSIAKVDNSDGSKVQIMICDIHSYLTAMQYMLSFNRETDIILYWDEPTISLDKETHPLHPIIQQNWKENKISKVVMSCATLPKEHEIQTTIDDFRRKFNSADVVSICSYDCKKSISLLNSEGKSVVPHLLFADYNQLQMSISHCFENKSLLRYFDLREIIRFICLVEDLIPDYCNPSNYFQTISEITMNSVKLYYLYIFKHIKLEDWTNIHHKMLSSQSISTSGILFTTNDAHTLTDGPTIYIAEDVSKIGKFYIQQSKIPLSIFNSIMDKIGVNNRIQQKMESLMKTLDDTLGKVEVEKENKMNRDRFNPDVIAVMNDIERLKFDIQMIAMEPVYVPNTIQHQKVWLPKNHVIVENAFLPNIEEVVVREIISLDVDNQLKILLLLGIGVFDVQSNSSYMEVMKRLAVQQKLFIVIASSDYIYGTNYQLCHGIIGKDLVDMTQQKIIQALGRIGRGNIQQEYTVRFRNDSILTKLFLPNENNIEAKNILKLLSLS